MSLKGISPLIAAVLLIAFTMAIAGIMAIWATTFSQQRLQTASECPALTVQDLSFVKGTDCNPTPGGACDVDIGSTSSVNLRLLNTNRNTAQTGIKASILFADGLNVEGTALSTLGPLSVRTDVINTERTGKSNLTAARRAEIITTECPTTPITAIIP